LLIVYEGVVLNIFVSLLQESSLILTRKALYCKNTGRQSFVAVEVISLGTGPDGVGSVKVACMRRTVAGASTAWTNPSLVAPTQNGSAVCKYVCYFTQTTAVSLFQAQ